MFVSVYLWFIEFGEFLYIGCSVHCFYCVGQFYI